MKLHTELGRLWFNFCPRLADPRNDCSRLMSSQMQFDDFRILLVWKRVKTDVNFNIETISSTLACHVALKPPKTKMRVRSHAIFDFVSHSTFPNTIMRYLSQSTHCFMFFGANLTIGVACDFKLSLSSHLTRCRFRAFLEQSE